MASLKDKLRSKMRPKNEPETMQCFDQTSLAVNLVQNKYQYSQLKIHCDWNNKSQLKPPKLTCRWYNRTQQNYQEIAGIQDQRYQPSILDIGSIIEVTCIPELPGVNYEGMPILLKSEPILLAPQTEKEATGLIEAGKGQLSVMIRQAKLNDLDLEAGTQATINILGSVLTISTQSQESLGGQIEITDNEPKIKINRRYPRQIEMRLKQEQFLKLAFKHHEIRDIFCLFVKLYRAKQVLQQMNQEITIKQPQVNSQDPENRQQQSMVKQSVAKETPQRVGSTTELLKLLDLKKTMKQLQQYNCKIQRQLQKEKQKAEVIKEKLMQTSQRLQNASNNYFELENKLQQAYQQIQVLNNQIKQYKSMQDQRQEEFLYYRNQTQLMTQQKDKAVQQLALLKQQHQSLNSQLQYFRELTSNNSNALSYQELQLELQEERSRTKELKLKSEYHLEKKEQLEEVLRNSRNAIEEIESQKKYIEKKYESLSNELHSISPSCRRSSPANSINKSVVYEEKSAVDRKEEQPGRSEWQERQMFELKKQLAQYVQENKQLKGMLVKDKKPSSRTVLKLQLMDAKKIVGRLTQTLSEKDAMLAELKNINKELNRRNTNLEQQIQTLLQDIKQ